MTVDDARRKCIALQNDNGHTEIEAENSRSDIPPFQDFAFGVWRAASRDRMGTSRRRFVDRMPEKQFLPAFGVRRLDCIRRLDVERWFDAYSKTAPGGANLALQLLRQILNAAVAAQLIAANPAEGIGNNPRPKFTRFLSTEEIDRLHRALDWLVDQ